MTDTPDLSRALSINAQLQGMSPDALRHSVRAIAEAVAEQLIATGIPVASTRFRPDIGPIQVDTIVVTIQVTRPELKVRLQFEVEDDMGVTIDVPVVEFLRDPRAWMTDTLQHLAPLRRNVMRLRRDTRARNERLYAALTQGA